MKRNTLAACVATLIAVAPAYAEQGVTRDEIRVGTILDLSGPAAALGKGVRNGMLMRMDEINAKGGIHGRKLTLVAEDDGYDPKKSVMAAQKLVGLDKVFIVAGHTGTAHNMAAMPIQFARGVPNFMPITSARAMYEPIHRLKYGFTGTYYDQLRVVTPMLVKEKKLARPCAIYQDDESGQEIVRGGEAGLKVAGLTMVETTSFKRAATDFSSQVAKLKAASCDLVILGTVMRETIGVMAEARKTGFSPVFLGSSAAYSVYMPRLGGTTVEGLYTGMTSGVPYPDDDSPAVREWVARYKAKFSEDPDIVAVYGYVVVDALGRIAQKAGPGLTVDAFIKAGDTMAIAPDIFGTPELKFTATQRLASEEVRLSQIREGKWKVISPYMK